MTTAQSFRLSIYSDAAALGGAEVNLSRVLEGLPNSIQVTIVGVDDDVVDWLRSHRPSAQALTIPAIENRTDLRGLSRHRSTFSRLHADVLQFNLSSASSCQWAMFMASFVRGPKRVAIENSPMGVWSGTSAKLKRFTSSRLAAHVAVGDRTGRMIEESSGLPTGSIETIYHGVPDVGHAIVERGPEPTLLTVARHDPVKGIDVLLDAFALVPAPARLVLIGDGTETDNLKAQRAELGLDDRVEFRPLPWDERAADVMWAYDGLVLPSRLEGFPVTIAEAMLAGLPVVATDVGSVSEAVIPGETGWIVEPENPTALAEAILDLLSDPERAKAMGGNARRAAESRFTMEATIAAYMSLYGRIL
ncbi:MAG: glycosyltransferase family 4 protein [Microthrixaceae bacterium]